MARSLHRSTAVVGLNTFASRISGLIRDTLMAIMFAAGPGMDAFLVAFKIPNFLRRISAEGAFTTAFVPVLSETKTKGSDAEVKELVQVVSGTLGGVLLLVSIIGVLAAPLLILLFAPGFYETPDKFTLAADLLRLTFPYLLFISLVSLCGGVLNTYGHFGAPAFTPVLLNVCIIGSALLIAPQLEQPVYALAIGVFLDGVIQLAFQFPFLWKEKLLVRPRWGWRDSRVRRILKLMLPVIFGSSVQQIALLLDTIIASFLITGSVSWLYYADRMMEFPLGIFTIAIATVILPSLSAQHARQSAESFSHTLDWALRLLLVIGTPAMVGLLVLAQPLLTTLFQYRAFTPSDAEMAAYALSAYAFGFMGFSLVKVLLPGFYARQDTMTPVRFGVIALSCSMPMSIAFVSLALWQEWAAPHAGLALSTSLGAFINAGLLFTRLRRDGVYRPETGWARLAGTVLLANLAMAAALLYLAGDVQAWFDWGLRERALRLGGTIVAGAATYFAALYLCGLRPAALRSPAH